MTAFQFREWWRYRRAAKGRHGVHSPFVYRLIEESLQKPLPLDLAKALHDAAPTRTKYQTAALLFRCMDFMQHEAGAGSILLTNDDAAAAEAGLAQLSAGRYVLLTGIHENPQRLALWEKLRGDARVNMSIDLWYVGMLLYRADFKEKQHFVLRYSA